MNQHAEDKTDYEAAEQAAQETTRRVPHSEVSVELGLADKMQSALHVVNKWQEYCDGCVGTADGDDYLCNLIEAYVNARVAEASDRLTGKLPDDTEPQNWDNPAYAEGMRLACDVLPIAYHQECAAGRIIGKALEAYGAQRKREGVRLGLEAAERMVEEKLVPATAARWLVGKLRALSPDDIAGGQ